MSSFLKEISLFFRGYHVDPNGKLTIRVHCFSGLEEDIPTSKLKEMEEELNRFIRANASEIKKDPHGYAKYIKENIKALVGNARAF